MNSQLVLFLILGTAVALPPPPPPAPGGQAANIPTEHFTNHEILDVHGKYELFWKYNKTHITFEAHVKTLGYVGFGLSPHGQMFPADMIIGWVKDGAVHFKDRHSVGQYEPIIDQSQDWHLLAGKEENGRTILKFVRKLTSCDKEDRQIEQGTSKVIYSWHDKDPVYETGLTYHGPDNRGSKSLLLLSPTQHRHLPVDAQHFDFVNKNFNLPAKYTYYHCTSYRVPKLDKKHHMVMFEPILTKGNEDVVHHMLVYHCPSFKNYNDSVIGLQYECYEGEVRRSLKGCMASTYLAWAVGGGPFYLPEQVGFPLFDDTDSGVFVLETHYTNPKYQSDIIDSSGLRMHYTPTIRQYDGDMVYTGLFVDEYHIVPPGYPRFLSTGYCSAECTKQALKDKPQGVNVFGIFPHSHLLGEAVRTRIIRQGEETVVSDDEHYDFDYQETRMLNKEVKIMPGDVIKTECVYKSDDQSKFTLGGLSTKDEMCISYLLYYPRVNLGRCASVPVYDNYGIRKYNDIWNLIANLRKMDWKNETIRNDFQKKTEESLYDMACNGHDRTFHRTRAVKPAITKKYEKGDTICDKKEIIIG